MSQPFILKYDPWKLVDLFPIHTSNKTYRCCSMEVRNIVLEIKMFFHCCSLRKNSWSKYRLVLCLGLITVTSLRLFRSICGLTCKWFALSENFSFIWMLLESNFITNSYPFGLMITAIDKLFYPHFTSPSLFCRKGNSTQLRKKGDVLNEMVEKNSSS